MIVVLRAHGLTFIIFVEDHEPAHVHVRGDGKMKVSLSEDRIELLSASGMKQGDIRKALSVVEERREMLLAKRRDIHG